MVDYVAELKSDNLLWKDIIQRVHIDCESYVRFLNCGTQGQVFTLDKNRVLKITTSIDDAICLSHFMKNPDELVVDVFDVFKVKNKYLIVAELLNNTTKDWKDFFEFVGQNYNTKNILGKLYRADSQIKKRFSYKVEWIKKVDKLFADSNIKYNDLHIGNVMKKGRHKIKIIDLGYSTHNFVEDIKSI